MSLTIPTILLLAGAPFLLWLTFCLIVMLARPTDDAIKIISVTG